MDFSKLNKWNKKNLEVVNEPKSKNLVRMRSIKHLGIER